MSKTIKLILITLIIFHFIPLLKVSAEDFNLYEDFENYDEINSYWNPIDNNSSERIENNFGHSGNSSLYSFDRKEHYSGPSINAMSYITKGVEHNISVWVFQNEDDICKMRCSARIGYKNGSSSFYTIKTIDVEKGNWTELTGNLTVQENVSDMVIYIETISSTTSFFIDDFSIISKKTTYSEFTPEDNKNINYNFENSEEGWMAYKDAQTARSSKIFLSGNSSLYIYNRNQANDGVYTKVDFLERNTHYKFSANIMQIETDSYDEEFLAEICYDVNGQSTEKEICRRTSQKNCWSSMNGTFTIPENASNIKILIHSKSSQSPISFYIDAINIKDITISIKKNILIFIISLVCSIFIAYMAILLVKSYMHKNEKSEEIIRLSETDAMTGALNRNAYEAKLEYLNNHPKKCKKIYVAVCDLNFLKFINDTYGHKFGDECISRCASVLLNAVEKKGEVYRTGGDEFVCITDVCVKNEIDLFLKKESEKDKGYPFSVAVGFSHYDEKNASSSPDIRQIIAQCDAEMYKNKLAKKQNFKKSNTYK